MLIKISHHNYISLCRNAAGVIFQSMESFLAPDYKDIAKQLEAMSLDSMVTLARSGRLLVRTARDAISGRLVEATKAAVHIAGPPCVDWSNAGSRNGMCGNALACTLLWASQRYDMQETMILHEHVVQCELPLICAILGGLYVMTQAVIDTSCSGWPSARARLITVFVHRRVFQKFTFGFATVVASCRRKCGVTWDQFLITNERSLQSDMDWCKSRASSCNHAANEDTLRRRCPALWSIQQEQPWQRILAYQDLSFLAGYRQLAQPGAYHVYFLNQDPDTHEQWSRGHGDRRLPTMVTNANMAWVEAPDRMESRLLAGKELAALNGFVVDEEQSAFGETSSFMCASGSRSRNSTCKQLGNAMSPNTMGIAIVFALSVVGMKDNASQSNKTTTPFMGRLLRRKASG